MEGMLNTYERNSWINVRRIRGNRAGVSGIVDNMTETGCNAQLFSTDDRELYTSVSYETAVIQCTIDD
jgi:hypothetical protein